jgi:hypothetical protein
MKRKALRRWVVLVAVFLILVVFGSFAAKRMKDFALSLRQTSQLAYIGDRIILFDSDFGSYPPSDANDQTGKPYCGAVKLAEAMMGQDLLGWNTKSVFRRDGMDATGTVDLYPDEIERLDPNLCVENLNTREGPYLQIEYGNAYRLADVYGKGKTGPLPEDAYVLCDIYKRHRPGGAETGMPILYYRANVLNRAHQAGDPNNIYDYRDNLALISLGVPGDSKKVHPLIDPKRFYLNTQNVRAASSTQPFRPEEFILISAGWDGLYGTADDICNFEWRYRER